MAKSKIQRRYRARECRFCGRLFWPKHPASKTCSTACQRADRTAQKKRVNLDAMRALANESNAPLTTEEELAHEQLLEAVDGLDFETKVKLRARRPDAKRMDIRVGMIHPLDVFSAQGADGWTYTPQT